jgi:hypothetical protein
METSIRVPLFLCKKCAEDLLHGVVMQLGFIPKMWQPSFPDVPQIPYTFTPQQPQANPGKRRRRKGNAKNAPAAEAGILLLEF